MPSQAELERFYQETQAAAGAARGGAVYVHFVDGMCEITDVDRKHLDWVPTPGRASAR